MTLHPARSQRGTVTAEAAIVLPLVAAFALALMWLVSVTIAEVRCVDAARDAARALARGDDTAAAAAAARRAAPKLARVEWSRDGTSVSVTVSWVAEPPGWLLVPFPGVPVRSTSSVEAEDGR